jgi:hypothetical protein
VGEGCKHVVKTHRHNFSPFVLLYVKTWLVEASSATLQADIATGLFAGLLLADGESSTEESIAAQRASLDMIRWSANRHCVESLNQTRRDHIAGMMHCQQQLRNEDVLRDCKAHTQHATCRKIEIDGSVARPHTPRRPRNIASPLQISWIFALGCETNEFAKLVIPMPIPLRGAIGKFFRNSSRLRARGVIRCSLHC